MSADKDGVRAWVGRISLGVPEGARRAGTAAELRRIALREVRLDGEPEERFARAFAAKLAEVDALRARRRGIAGTLRSRVALAPEPDRFEVVLYHGRDEATVLDAAALRQRGEVGLWLTRASVPTEDERALLDTVSVLGEAYRALPEGAPRPEAAFHLPDGFVALPFQEQELAEARWVGGGVEVTVATRAVREPAPGGLMERFGRAVDAAGPARTGAVSVPRCRLRTTGGLAGEEFVMRDSGDGRLYFLWEFPGEADSGTRPKIQLTMMTADGDTRQKLALWDALVDSLRPAP